MVNSNKKNYKNRNGHLDERVNFTNEVIEGIRLIKMYGLETAFEKMLSAYR